MLCSLVAPSEATPLGIGGRNGLVIIMAIGPTVSVSTTTAAATASSSSSFPPDCI